MMRARQTVYYAKHREQILARKAYNRRRNPLKRKNENLVAKYGVTIEWYNQQLTAQYGKCAICGVPANMCKHPLGVDHSHVTGHVRGLLCMNCNTGIGQFKDSVELLSKTMTYLQNYDNK